MKGKNPVSQKTKTKTISEIRATLRNSLRREEKRVRHYSLSTSIAIRKKDKGEDDQLVLLAKQKLRLGRKQKSSQTQDRSRHRADVGSGHAEERRRRPVRKSSAQTDSSTVRMTSTEHDRRAEGK